MDVFVPITNAECALPGSRNDQDQNGGRKAHRVRTTRRSALHGGRRHRRVTKKQSKRTRRFGRK